MSTRNPSVDVELDDEDEEIERRMEAWADPIADRLIAFAAEKGFAAHPEWKGEDLREGTATLAVGVLVMLAEAVIKQLPRELQLSGGGAMRFARDASGEVCVAVDGIDLGERVCLAEGYRMIFGEHGFTPALIEEAVRLAEASVLEGTAFLMGFAYDAAASAPDAAVYVRAATAAELALAREQWEAHDEMTAHVDGMRKAHAARITAALEEAGSPLPAFIKDGLTAEDLALALDILGAGIETFLYGAVVATLRRDGSLLTAQDQPEVPAAFLLARLTEDFATAKPGGLAIDPAALLAWCVDAGWIVPLFEGLDTSPADGGLAIAFSEEG